MIGGWMDNSSNSSILGIFGANQYLNLTQQVYSLLKVWFFFFQVSPVSFFANYVLYQR